MSKNHIAALRRAESRLTKVLELDELRMSRGAKTRIEGALKDVSDVIAMETAKAAVPEGFVRLSVNLNAETADALKGMRLRQRGPNGSPITFTETIRRTIGLAKWVFDERDKGRMILSQNSDGTKRKELVVL